MSSASPTLPGLALLGVVPPGAALPGLALLGAVPPEPAAPGMMPPEEVPSIVSAVIVIHLPRGS
jgi:hypothetical protein